MPARDRGLAPSRYQSELHRGTAAWLATAVMLATASMLGVRRLSESTSPHLAASLLHLSLLLVFLAVVLTIWCAGATALTWFGARRLRLLLPSLPAEVRAMDRWKVALALVNLQRWTPTVFATANFRVASGEHVLWTIPQVAPAIGGGDEKTLAWEIVVRKRGPLVIGPFVVRLEFPGSLLRTALVFDYHRELLALPAVYELTSDVLQVLAGRRETGANTPAPGGEGEFAGVRDWRPGDPVRLIHRALSVRAPDFPRQLVVRECENPATGDVLVVLDNAVSPGDPRYAELSWRREKAICFVAALCKLLLEQKYRVHFLTHTTRRRRLKVPLGRRRSDLVRLERTLARLAPADKRADLWTLPDPESLRTGSIVAYVSLRRQAEEDRHPGLSVVTITPDSIGPLTRRVRSL